MKFSKSWVLLFCFAFLISACGNESKDKINPEEVRKDILKDYPEGVKNGSVSVEYYKNLLSFHETYLDKIKKYNEYASASKIDGDSLKNVLKEIPVYTKTLTFTPNTKEEKEINEYVVSTSHYFEEWANYQLQYFDTKDNNYKKLAEDSLQSFQHNSEMIVEIMNHHKLFD